MLIRQLGRRGFKRRITPPFTTPLFSIGLEIYSIFLFHTLFMFCFLIGFWPAVDGVAEHTQVLTHILRDAKLHQRSVTVVLLDLKNAFGEIHHNLIATALELHRVPDHIRQIVKNIYTNSRTAVSFNDQVTDFYSSGTGGFTRGSLFAPYFQHLL